MAEINLTQLLQPEVFRDGNRELFNDSNALIYKRYPRLEVIDLWAKRSTRTQSP